MQKKKLKKPLSLIKHGGPRTPGGALLGPGSYDWTSSDLSARPRSTAACILPEKGANRKGNRFRDGGSAGGQGGVSPARATAQWQEKGFFSARSAKTGHIPPKQVDQM